MDRLTDRRVDLVAEGFDLAVRGTARLEHASLVARRLTTLTHVVCTSPDYLARHGPIAHPEALTGHRVVQYSLAAHAEHWTFQRGREERRVAVSGRYRVSSSLAVREALREGFGVALVPRRYVAEDLAAGTLVSVLDDWRSHETPLYAVYPSRTWLDPKVRCFVDFLVAILQDPTSTPHPGPGRPLL